jgi:hypothetical protein
MLAAKPPCTAPEGLIAAAVGAPSKGGAALGDGDQPEAQRLPDGRAAAAVDDLLKIGQAVL